MKNPNRILFFAVFLLFASACGSMKQAFSDAKPYRKDAETLFEKGQYAESLVKIMEGLKVDPKYDKAKLFLLENFEKANTSILSEIESIGTPTEMEPAARKAFLYDQLVKFYTELSTFKMPLKHRKGKWKWSTEIIDYKPQLAAAKKEAFEVFFTHGTKELTENRNAETAYKNYVRGYNDFVEGDNQPDARRRIVEQLMSFGKKHDKAQAVDLAIQANYAYQYVLKFENNHDEARSLQKTSALWISDLYLKLAQQTAQSNEAEALEEAVRQCESSLAWNKANEEASALLDDTKHRLAEIFYQRGQMGEKQNAPAQEIIENYETAMKWVLNYKDAQKRIYVVYIGEDLKETERLLDITNSEYSRIASRITPIATKINTGVSVMDKITYVTDKTGALDQNMQSVHHTLITFNVIPTVGTVTSFTSRNVERVRKPVHSLNQKLVTMQKPVITPVKNAFTTMKTTTDRIVTGLAVGKTTINGTRKMISVLRQCAENTDNADKLKNVSQYLRETNKSLVKTNQGLSEVNKQLDVAEKFSNSQIQKLKKPVEKVAAGMSKVQPIMGKISGLCDKLSSVIDHKIKIPFVGTFSLGAALRKGGKVLKVFNSFINKALNPVLKKLKIQIPDIPGVKETEQALDNLQQNYRQAIVAANEMKDKYNLYEKSQQAVKANINKIAQESGCGNVIQ